MAVPKVDERQIKTSKGFRLFLKLMKTLILLLFASCFVFTASSQRVYFMYLQSENNAPFYVRMGDKIHSSTVSGYLIMSELVDSTYSFAVGFAGSADASKFKISLDNKDQGFLIK